MGPITGSGRPGFPKTLKEFIKAAPDAPKVPGASCDHCGTSIAECFLFRAADGKTFKVGSVCVGKSGDRGLIDVVKRAANEAARATRATAAKLTLDWLRATLADPAVCAALGAEAHPNGWTGKTLLTWAEWMLAHAGASGRAKVARLLRARGIK